MAVAIDFVGTMSVSDQALAQALSEGVICLDGDGHLLWWNDAASGLLKLTDDNRGDLITDVFTHKKFGRYFDLKKFDDVLELPSPTFSNRHLTAVFRQYNDNLLLLVRDVTHTHVLDRIRQDFIANVSHELRTPLTVFHGYLELLIDNDVNDPAILKDILQQMMGQSRRMELLVKDLLLLSRLEGDEPDISQHRAVNVAGILRMIVDDAKALSGDKQHVFGVELDDAIEIEGDPEELHSAFSNLIFNAVHYTPAHGEIGITLSQQGKHVQLDVSDTGLGIDEKDIPKLTQRFYRVDKARSRDDGRSGTGLGLAIVKHVLIRHQAELVIASKLGQGSTFSCIF